MSKVYLSLGSNLGDRLHNLQRAVNEIKNTVHLTILKVSKVYETEPIGNFNQPMYYNIIIEVETELSPLELLKELRKIEYALGRERHCKWGPRVIDIDIVLYDDVVMVSDDLTIPHPEFRKRRFVLVPLVEVCDNLVDPLTGKKVSDYLSDSCVEGKIFETCEKITI